MSAATISSGHAARGPASAFHAPSASAAATTAPAALTIAALAAVIGVATWYERDYGRHAAATMIYTSWWFAAIFVLLAINIFGAAAVRYPWKRRQHGFVVVHIGLLTLIAGFFRS